MTRNGAKLSRGGTIRSILLSYQIITIHGLVANIEFTNRDWRCVELISGIATYAGQTNEKVRAGESIVWEVIASGSEGRIMTAAIQSGASRFWGMFGRGINRRERKTRRQRRKYAHQIAICVNRIHRQEPAWGEDTIIAECMEYAARALAGRTCFNDDISGWRSRRMPSRRCMAPVRRSPAGALLAGWRHSANMPRRPVVSWRIAYQQIPTIEFGLVHYPKGLGASSFGSFANLVAKPLKRAERNQS